MHVLVELAVVVERGPFERGVLAVAADQGEVVVIHRRAVFVQVAREFGNFAHVFARGGGDGVDAEARVPPLQLGECLAGLHGAGEGVLHAAESVVIFGHAVEREFDGEELEGGFAEDLFDGGDGAVREAAVSGDVDLANAVVADEKAADFGEFLAEKGFAAGEVEVLHSAELLRETAKFVDGEIVFPVQVPPVEAVFAGLVADRVDEENQKWRGRTTADPFSHPVILKRQTKMTHCSR